MVEVAATVTLKWPIVLKISILASTAERYGSSSSVVFQNYKFNFATENSEQLLSVFVSGSVVMTVILNTTFVLWLTAQSVHCTLLQPGCTKIFNGLDLIQFSVANGTAGDQLHLPFGSAVTSVVCSLFFLPLLPERAVLC